MHRCFPLLGANSRRRSAGGEKRDHRRIDLSSMFDGRSTEDSRLPSARSSESFRSGGTESMCDRRFLGTISYLLHQDPNSLPAFRAKSHQLNQALSSWRFSVGGSSKRRSACSCWV